MKRGQVFKVEKVLSEVNPPLYQLVDLMADPVKGNFYSEQLLKTNVPGDRDLFEIEKVLKTKTVKGKKFLLVKYLYYPSKFNQYVSEENLVIGQA